MRYQTPTAEITLINAREDILLTSGDSGSYQDLDYNDIINMAKSVAPGYEE